jgi:hypothetical protein
VDKRVQYYNFGLGTCGSGHLKTKQVSLPLCISLSLSLSLAHSLIFRIFIFLEVCENDNERWTAGCPKR